MTPGAGRGMQCLRMTIAAGCSAMINASSTFICNARVRAVIFCKPAIRRVASSTIETEQTRMVARIPMTTRAGCRQPGKLARSMAFLASQAHMAACQRERAQVVIEVSVLPTGWIMTR